MSSVYEIVLYAVFISIFLLDEESFGRFMLSRPLPLSFFSSLYLKGWGVWEGVEIGALLELFWMNVYPVGGTTPPSVAFATAAVLYPALFLNIPSSIKCVLAFILSIPLAHGGVYIQGIIRRINTSLGRWVKKNIKKGLWRIDAGIYSSLFFCYIINACFLALILLLLKPLFYIFKDTFYGLDGIFFGIKSLIPFLCFGIILGEFWKKKAVLFFPLGVALCILCIYLRIPVILLFILIVSFWFLKRFAKKEFLLAGFLLQTQLIEPPDILKLHFKAEDKENIRGFLVGERGFLMESDTEHYWRCIPSGTEKSIGAVFVESVIGTVIKGMIAGENLFWARVKGNAYIGGDDRPPAPHEQDIKDIHCIGKKIWMVGEGGIILHSTDGGKTWTNQVSGVTKDCLDVVFLDENTGFTVGKNGLFLKTTDGGKNWSPITHNWGEGSTLWSIEYADGVFWICVEKEGHGYIYKYDDKTKVFTLHYRFDYSPIYSISVRKNAEGVLIGICVGKNIWAYNLNLVNKEWTLKLFDASLFCVQFVEENKAIGCGENASVVIFEKKEEGFESKKIESGAFFPLKDIAFLREGVGITGGWNRALFYTKNGEDWKKADIFPEEEGLIFNKLCFDEDGNAWACAKRCVIEPGEPSGIFGYIYKSTDYGRTWRKVFGPGSKIGKDTIYPGAFNAIALYKKDHCIAAGFIGSHPGLFYTEDGGKNWNIARLPEGFEDTNFLSLSFVEGGIGIAAGFRQDEWVIMKSEDGGKNWTLLYKNVESDAPFFAFLMNEEKGFVAGGHNLLFTEDGGTTWNRHSLPIYIFCADVIEEMPFIAGASDTVVRLGEDFLPKERLSLKGWIYGMHFLSPYKGYACGNLCRIYVYKGLPKKEAVSIKVYPNPYIPGDGIASTGTEESGIYFGFIPEGAEIRIYTLSGELVKEYKWRGGEFRWDTRDDRGEHVGSGIYLFTIKMGKKVEKGKFLIIR